MFSKTIGFLTDLSSSIFGPLLATLKTLPPFWSLTLISIISGIILCLIYGRLSNQARLKQVKRNIHAALLESILFRHDVALSLRSQGRMFLFGMYYLALAIPPILILSIPSLLLLGQLNLYYGYRALEPGERVIVRAKIKDRETLYNTSLSTSPGLVSTPPIRVGESKEILWRLEVTQDIPQAIDLKLKEMALTIPIIVRPGFAPMVAQTYTSPWWQLLYPSTSLKGLAGMVSEFSIDYPAQSYRVFGLEWSWIGLFLVLSILSGIVASRLFRVEI